MKNVSNDLTKMKEVIVSYAIPQNKCCKGTYSWQAFPHGHDGKINIKLS